MQELGPMPSPSAPIASKLGRRVHWLLLTSPEDEYCPATAGYWRARPRAKTTEIPLQVDDLATRWRGYIAGSYRE